MKILNFQKPLKVKTKKEDAKKEDFSIKNMKTETLDNLKNVLNFFRRIFLVLKI